MDLILVACMVLAEIRSPFKGYRLLGFIRLWRVFRLINTLLDVERKRHDETKTNLLQQKTVREFFIEVYEILSISLFVLLVS
jgi:hypothetical protein